MLRFWQKRKETQERAHRLAIESLAAARDPAYYRDLGVPDTFDGRFEIAVLELFIRLYRHNDSALSQQAFNAFFRQMELSLREAGVGDLGVPRHMKRMMSGFNGRVRHYWQAVDNNDPADLVAALTRNVYGTVQNTSPRHIEMLADKTMTNLQEAPREITAQ